MNKQTTVFRLGMSRNNNNEVVIEVHDAHSGDIILRAEMNLENTALFLTGLHGVSATGFVNEDASIAKKREVMSLHCVRVNSFDKDEQYKLVLDHFITEGYAEDGWVIHDFGLNSQQRGSEHKYNVKRYIDVDDPEILERSY